MQQYYPGSAEVRAECHTLLAEVAQAEALVASLRQQHSRKPETEATSDFFLYATRPEHSGPRLRLPEVSADVLRTPSDYSSPSTSARYLSPSRRSVAEPNRVGGFARAGHKEHSPGLRALEEVTMDEATAPSLAVSSLAISARPDKHKAATSPNSSALHSPKAHSVDHTSPIPQRGPTKPAPRRPKQDSDSAPSPIQNLSPGSVQNSKGGVLPDIAGPGGGVQLPDVMH